MTSPDGADVCRITVIGPSRRMDVAVPGYVSFADLFPTLAKYAGLEGPDVVGEKGGWVLQRLGEGPFSPAMTPIQAGLRDGEIIYLRPHREQLPPMTFDDVADVIATGLSDRPGRWAPGHARWVALGAVAGALVAGAVFIARSGPPWQVPASVAAAVAVVLLLAVVAVSRAVGDSRAGVVLGCAAIPYAFLAGLLTPARSAPLSHLGAVEMVAALAAVALAAVIAAAASAEVSLFFGIVVAAVFGVLGAWLSYAFGIGLAAAAALMAVLTLALTPLIPAVSFRMGRMTLPEVPRHADDLRRDTLTIDGAQVFDRTAVADRFVTGAASGIGLVAGFAEAVLAFTHGWLGMVSCAVLACVLLLRSRLFKGLAQRLWLLVPGFAGLILLAAGAIHGSSQANHLALALGPLIAGSALVAVIGLWLPGHRPSPFFGRIGDIADTMLNVGLFPLALALAGVFGKARGLGG
jgi:type VII secretion integral membrane protein EccD